LDIFIENKKVEHVKVIEVENSKPQSKTGDNIELSKNDNLILSPKLNNLSKLNFDIKNKDFEFEKSYNLKEIESSKSK